VSTTISASLVKELRDATGAGMMDCKRALEETEGDLDAARTLLRERGMASAGKRAGRETTEGLVGFIVEDGVGSIVGIGCETEPVSKNDEFQEFAIKVLRAVHSDGADVAETFEQERVELIARLGENVVIVNPTRYEAPDGNVPRRLPRIRRRTRSACSWRPWAARRSSLANSRCTSRSPPPSGRRATTCPPRFSRASARSIENSDEVQSKPRPRVRRSWTAC
jgi:hypothetical protein